MMGMVLDVLESKTKHEEYLETQRSLPLYAGLSKYQHVERLGHKEVEGILDGPVTVQEKIDGANATVAYIDNKLVVASRNNTISVDGTPPTGFRGLVEYVLANPGFYPAPPIKDWILRGEWLVHHSLRYRDDVYGHLYIFDVQRPDGSYVLPSEYEPVLAAAGLRFVPVAAEFTSPTPEQLLEVLQRDSTFGAPMREGIVIKRYDFVNQYGRVQWGKMIHGDFKQKNSLFFRAPKSADAEVRFVSMAVTPELVRKTIAKVAFDKQEDASVRHMATVLGRVWYDVFKEELWDFTQKQRVGAFDFAAARRLATEKTRDIALAVYNGFPTIHGEETTDYLAK